MNIENICEVTTLNVMLKKYLILIESRDFNLMACAGVASCIKDFISYCWIKNLIPDGSMYKIYSFNILSDKSEHMKFYIECKNLIDGQPSETVNI